jgi:L-aspartate semialdehyde sulfurtransferase ferredoxin
MAKLRVKLTFPEQLIKEPVIYNLAAKFEIVTNIRRANVEQKVGWVVLEMEAEEEALKAGLQYLDDVGVIVEQLDAGLEG